MLKSCSFLLMAVQSSHTDVCWGNIAALAPLFLKQIHVLHSKSTLPNSNKCVLYILPWGFFSFQILVATAIIRLFLLI